MALNIPEFRFDHLPVGAGVNFICSRLVPALILFLLIWLLAYFIRRLFDRLMVRSRIDHETALLVSRAIYLGITGLAIFALTTALLANTNTAIWGVIGAALIAGLGLQEIFSNYISGFYILLERTIRIGDRVETQGFSGTVVGIKMRVTYLRDGKKLIVVPNSELFGKVSAIVAPHDEVPATERPSEASTPGS